jgi:hypothetical protein
LQRYASRLVSILSGETAAKYAAAGFVFMVI